MNQKRNTLLAFCLITSLFFLWGLAHNPDAILIPHLKRPFTLTTTQATLVDSAIFALGIKDLGADTEYRVYSENLSAKTTTVINHEKIYTCA